jgi:hypothetical protein
MTRHKFHYWLVLDKKLNPTISRACPTKIKKDFFKLLKRYPTRQVSLIIIDKDRGYKFSQQEAILNVLDYHGG